MRWFFHRLRAITTSTFESSSSDSAASAARSRAWLTLYGDGHFILARLRFFREARGWLGGCSTSHEEVGSGSGVG